MVADWLPGALKRAEKCRSLPDNWDSYGARAVHPDSVNQARTFLKQLAEESDIPAPSLVSADIDGRILIQWNTATQELDIICCTCGVLAYDWCDDKFPHTDAVGNCLFQEAVAMVRKLRIEEASDV